jgi:elongation factor G
VEFDYTHRKQTGGAGQYGRVIGSIEPLTEGDFEFVDRVRGGAIPRNLIPSVEKGFKLMQEKGPLVEAPLVHVRVILEDGAFHEVDSGEAAFIEAARGAWREAVPKAEARILEPIMKVTVEAPVEFTGPSLATLNQRRGVILGTLEESGQVTIEAEVPLATMVGYATALRSITEGKASFSMEFNRYLPVPRAIQDELIEKASSKKKSGVKS